MNWIDFFIGFFLMNSMPHFVLGIWKGRMFSAFGFGNKQNIAYSLLNFGMAFGLFLYEYGWEGFRENGIFLGAFVVLGIYFLTGRFFQRLFQKPANS